MTGMLLPQPFVAVFPELVREVGIEQAAILQFIGYHQDEEHGVVLRIEDIAAGTGISDRTVRRCLLKLRETGLLIGVRDATWKSTQRWRVDRDHAVFAGQCQTANLATSRVPDLAASQTANLATSPPVLEVEESIGADEPLFAPPLALVTDTTPAQKPARRATRRHALPETFRPSDKHHALAAQLGVDLAVEGPLFREHHTANGSLFVSWDAALNTWIRKSAKWAAEREARYGPQAPSRPAVGGAGDEYVPGAENLLPPPRTSPW